MVSGTTSPVVAELEQLFYDPAQRVWTDAGLGAESYQVEMNPGVTGLNYQRVKDRLCADIPYERLEEIYKEKTSFACTASFSSLLFYQRALSAPGRLLHARPAGRRGGPHGPCVGRAGGHRLLHP